MAETALIYDRSEMPPITRVAKTAPTESRGVVYVAMLEDQRLSPMAKLCYGVMGSFGPESRAAVSSIARRMGVSHNTVRAAQKKLKKAGWIKFLGQDEMGIKHWSLGRPSKIEEGRPQSMHPSPSPAEGGVLQKLKAKLEHNQEAKQEGEHPSAVGAGEALERFKERYYATKGMPYRLSGPDRGAASQLFKSNCITMKELEYAIDNFLKDDPAFAGGHCAAFFFGRFSAYQFGPIVRGGSHQRKGNAGDGAEPRQGRGVYPSLEGRTGRAGGTSRRRNDPPLD